MQTKSPVDHTVYNEKYYQHVYVQISKLYYCINSVTSYMIRPHIVVIFREVLFEMYSIENFKVI